MNVHTLEDLLFSPENLPLLKEIKEKGGVNDSELKQKVHQLSGKSVKKLIEIIQSVNVLQPDPKIQRKICGQLLGVRFSPDCNDSDEETITFKTPGITKNFHLLTSALVNQFIQDNNLALRRNGRVDQVNKYTHKLNGLVDLFNQFLPIETNDIDALLSHGHYILENQLSLSGNHPFQKITALENKRILEEIEKKETRSLTLIEMQPVPLYPAIELTQQKIILLSTIISEQLYSFEQELLEDIRLIKNTVPKILDALRSSFDEEELFVFQHFFNRFLDEILPDLS